MEDDFRPQIICLLHNQHDCEYRSSYEQSCRLKVSDGFVKANCPYRIEATVLAAAEKEESPVSDVQQPHVETVVNKE